MVDSIFIIASGERISIREARIDRVRLRSHAAPPKAHDCLTDIGAALGNTENRLWEMRNGYALATQSGLVEIGQRLRAADEDELDKLRQLLRIGIQWKTQVTLNGCKHLVSQAYCSALPVAYSYHSSDYWAEFARL